MEENKKTASKKDHTKIGAVIVLIITIIVFIPTGGAAVFQSLFNKDTSPVFGTYRGKKIEYKRDSKFANQIASITQQKESTGVKVTEQDYMSIFQQAFQETIENIYFEDEVKKSGYEVPTEAINRLLVPIFSENGEYSQRLYNQTDAATRKSLHDSAEEALIHSRYQKDIFGVTEAPDGSALYGLKNSEAEANFVQSLGNEKHSFELTAFSTASLPDEQVVAYGKEHADLFAKYSLSAITVSEESDAKAILKQIQNSEITFEDAVSEKSEQLYTEKDGTLSSPYYFQLKNTVKDESSLAAILALGQGELSTVIATAQGYSIFRGDGDKKEADFSDEATLSVAKSYITANERGYIENYYIGIAENFIMETARLKEQIIEQTPTREEPNPAPIIITPFQQACTKYNVQRVEVPAFAVNYGNTQFYETMPSSVTELSSLSSSASALEAMFALKESEISKPFVLGNNVLVVRCTSIENNVNTENSSDTYVQLASYYDQRTGLNRILQSDDLDNQFWNAYIAMMYQN